MKKIFLDIKTLIAELVGLFGGFFWAKSTHWDYEPLILFIISLASLLITFCFHFFYGADESRLKQQTNSTKSNVEENLPEKTGKTNSLNNLDAKKIGIEIENAQPYLREQVEDSYKGLGIKWKVSFYSIRNTSGNVYNVSTLYEGNYPWVYFDIDINDYPFFKIAKKEQPFFITGKIKHVNAGTFTINVEKIHES